MDTRSKILTLAETQELRIPGLCVAIGYFDVLTPEHIRDLEKARAFPGATALLVAVLQREHELLGQRARAELAASLRVVDYVVTADRGDLDTLIDSLKPLETTRLESCDTRRAQQLIEHVHSRQDR